MTLFKIIFAPLIKLLGSLAGCFKKSNPKYSNTKNSNNKMKGSGIQINGDGDNKVNGHD
ncbi:hypothetical protein N2E09_07835 [Leuconostoc citreum]|uniref:hypothetical protein n=1 Tax=Leuconostoc TaxID=1243 RepID=UPI001CC5E6C0|nr:hypothetical protein [Leuconostoc gasicomitatum]MBZ5957726.1 hypothetical protein [Leuconostoc gasicomitatum]MBZ5969745.1 hypothetical protein [Leuconostoc gasicomitatum]